MKKMPPKQKILEAYTAIADQHVKLDSDHNQAFVISSNEAKEYTVSWDGAVFKSNGSASYWQGYPGYPVIAVLMLLGKLPLDQKMVSMFKGVNWNKINKECKRNYDKAAQEVISERGLDSDYTQHVMDSTFEQLSRLNLVIKRKGVKIIKLNQN